MLMVKRKHKTILEIFLWTFIFVTFQKYWLKMLNPTKTATKRKYINGQILDYSGQYQIIRFVGFKGIPEDYNYQDVTLATQCSVNHLHHLVELTRKWNGPVSCSVFVPNQDASVAFDAIRLLRSCFTEIDSHVIFNFVYPSQHPADISSIGDWDNLSCTELLDKLENYGYQNYVVGDLSFPHNVLRNAARSSVLTEFVFVVDIDVVPNTGLRHKFIDFAHRKSFFGSSDLVAFVVPVFEVKSNSEVPEDKKELLEKVCWKLSRLFYKSQIFQIRQETIRPFHNETCWWCHRAENIDKWKRIPQNLNEINIAFKAVWDKSWEPFYIANRIVPLFDGRFKQYGFDRIQQICEMHVAGYIFQILDNAFLTHKGWKLAGKFYANKDLDNAQNWILFNYHFKDELLVKYNTNRTCSPLEVVDIRKKKKMNSAGKSVVSRFHQKLGIR